MKPGPAATATQFVEAAAGSPAQATTSRSGGMAAKPISSPVVMVSVGLMLTASFFIYEATSSRRSRSLAKEIATAALASVFVGFGSLLVLLASGVYV